MRSRRLNRSALALVALGAALMLVAASAAGAADAASPTPAPSPLATSTAAPGSGEALFVENCSGCHGLHGEGRIGPPLAADAVPGLVYGMVTRGGIEMYSFQRQLTEAQRWAIARYVAGTLSDPAARNADVNEGSDIFRFYCSGCHSATARGGALSQGPNAPSLAAYPAAEAIAAMILGRGNMPPFAGSTLDTREQTSVALYVGVLESPPSPGGHGLGWLGPVTEGFAAAGGLLVLLALTVWLAWGKRRQAPEGWPESASAGSDGGALSAGGVHGD